MEELQKYFPQLVIHHGDALKINPKDLCEKSDDDGIHILSNLPYHISTALLTKWFYDLEIVQSMTLMFQKEVADRIIAEPNNKEYGRLSVISQYACTIDHGFDLSPHLFTPPPKVHSSVLHFKPKADTDTDLALLKKIEVVTQQAFSMRRKMIRSTLKPLFSEEELTKLNIPLTDRAENLSVDQFVLMAKELKN
jgi:16S rRNA (adenine1518-N6/adenine1519-N6)-dimethyltransferase